MHVPILPQQPRLAMLSPSMCPGVLYVQVCNHPRLCYPDSEHFWEQNVVRTCGKMYWLDQILVKLYATGHRVLLFSTMTRMLDTVEFYLNWRKVDKNDGSGEKMLMKSRRIDGATTLDNREAAIKEFNSPDSGEATCYGTEGLGYPRAWAVGVSKATLWLGCDVVLLGTPRSMQQQQQQLLQANCRGMCALPQGCC